MKKSGWKVSHNVQCLRFQLARCPAGWPEGQTQMITHMDQQENLKMLSTFKNKPTLGFWVHHMVVMTWEKHTHTKTIKSKGNYTNKAKKCWLNHDLFVWVLVAKCSSKMQMASQVEMHCHTEKLQIKFTASPSNTILNRDKENVLQHSLWSFVSVINLNCLMKYILEYASIVLQRKCCSYPLIAEADWENSHSH